MKTLNISLPDPLAKLVESKVQSGGYSSASEVVREGLRLLQQYDAERLRTLKLAIQEGLDSPIGPPLEELRSEAIAARGAKRLKRARREAVR